MFEGSSINAANPASFSFDVPLTVEKDESIIIDLLGDLTDGQLKKFDIYMVTTNSTFKLENAIIMNATMDFIPDNPFTVRLEGEGTKLSRVGNESYSLPGSAQSESSTRTPLMIYPVISADSLDMNNIMSINLRISNEINWTNFGTLQDSLAVTSSSNAMFPSAYTVEKRTASGEIRQYQTDNNVTQFDDFSTSTDLTIKAVEIGKASNATPFFQIQLNPVSYTARLSLAEVFMQSYDFSSLDNTAIGTRITQYS
tara:strand:+ start:2908 stop:3672 length:765 start_codon:yes stop_codon:yes gene_type:complete